MHECTNNNISQIQCKKLSDKDFKGQNYLTVCTLDEYSTINQYYTSCLPNWYQYTLKQQRMLNCKICSRSTYVIKSK